jgi:L-ascorbate metabolism protein UlaG (beta-lactamase superfamily)
MIKPILQDDEFLASVRAAAPGKLHLWWLGQSGFLVKWGHSHLLMDPYLSDSLTKKYALTDKPHVRVTERVVAPERLDFVDVLTASHNHTDHLDAETVIPILKANPNLTVIVSRANLGFAADRLQVPPARLMPIRADSQVLEVGPFRFHAIPSAHEGLEQDENGDQKFIGYVVEAGGRTFYHSGDACPYDGLVERLRKWKIDLALLPINGRDPALRVAGNFSAQEAVDLGLAIRAGKLIPCHYDMFAFNSANPAGFIQYALANGVDQRVLKNGEQFSL